MTSFDRPAETDIPPSSWIMRFAPLIRRGGLVLDVAAGHGRHARALAARGHRVIAADIDISGLEGAAHVEKRNLDLETGAWPFAEKFDAIVVANYLHRPHFPHYVESLSPGGVLLIDTFGAGNEKMGRPRNPDFLLQPGELIAAFAPSLEIVAYEYGAEETPRPAVRQRICAVKGAGPHALL